MKRWIIFLGRGGTVLIAIGLALLLASLIPPANLGSFGASTFAPPKMFTFLFEKVLTPQQGLQVTMTANGTLNFYVFEVDCDILFEWLGGSIGNVTKLEELLEENPDVVGWHAEIRNGKIEHEYVPTKVINATIILSNPSSDYVNVDCEGSVISVVAPGTKVRNLAQWAIPIGFVLALPWLAQLRKEKTAHRDL